MAGCAICMFVAASLPLTSRDIDAPLSLLRCASQDMATCSQTGATNFNVTQGTAPGTVVFTVVNNAPDAAIGLCVDYNAGIGQLELYQCYK